MKRGLLITVEGTDGAGKSTQIDFICKYFEKKGIYPILIREPGSTTIGEKIREILLDNENKNMSYVTEMLLYAAARAQLVEEVIRPAVIDGKVIICDRFLDSSIAYQGYGRGLENAVVEVNKYAIQEIQPDLTIFIDIPINVSKNRVLENREDVDRMESQASEFHKKVVEGYGELAKKYPERIKRINGNQSIENVSRQIEKCLNELNTKKQVSDERIFV